jgi:hypothetical protein
VFKAGLDGDFSGYDHKAYYTATQRWRRSPNTAAGAPGRWQLREFYGIERNLTDAELMDPANVPLDADQSLCANDKAICTAIPQKSADTLNRTIAAFVQDSWQIRPNFTLNLGLRYEQQVGYVADELQGTISPEGETVPEVAYTLNNWAPRIGFIYDPTKEGKSKLYGHYGQFYENVPMDINVRAFGGEILNLEVYNFNRRPPGAGGYDPNCDQDHSAGVTATRWCRGSRCARTASTRRSSAAATSTYRRASRASAPTSGSSEPSTR